MVKNCCWPKKNIKHCHFCQKYLKYKKKFHSQPENPKGECQTISLWPYAQAHFACASGQWCKAHQQVNLWMGLKEKKMFWNVLVKVCRWIWFRCCRINLHTMVILENPLYDTEIKQFYQKTYAPHNDRWWCQVTPAVIRFREPMHFKIGSSWFVQIVL